MSDSGQENWLRRAFSYLAILTAKCRHYLRGASSKRKIEETGSKLVVEDDGGWQGLPFSSST